MTDFEQSQELADQQLQQRLAAERERDDLIHVMESPQGRRVIWKVLESAGVFSVTFTGDNNYTNFNEGRRNEGLRLFTDVMKHCPDLYLTMAKEAGEESDK